MLPTEFLPEIAAMNLDLQFFFGRPGGSLGMNNLATHLPFPFPSFPMPHRPRSAPDRANQPDVTIIPVDVAPSEPASVNTNADINTNADGDTNAGTNTNAGSSATSNRPQDSNQASAGPTPAPSINPPAAAGRPQVTIFGFGTTRIPSGGMPFLFPRGAPGARPGQQRKEWTPPPPPGLTLRQRIERHEREAGLRCDDVSCGQAPSDEDPDHVPANWQNEKQKMLAIKRDRGAGEPVCEHRFHPVCLVDAGRVAGWGPITNGDAGEEGVEVACPRCRETGHVEYPEWEEGVRASEVDSA